MLLGDSTGPGAGTSELQSWALGQLWHDFTQPPCSAKQCAERQPRVGQGSHTLAPIRATLGSAPAKGSGASPQRKQARPRPGPLCGRVPPPRLAGQQQARVTGTLDGREEGTSKRSALGPMGAAAQALARWSGPGGLGEGRAQSSTFNDVPDTDGKAGPGKKPAPPAVQQADGENLP